MSNEAAPSKKGRYAGSICGESFKVPPDAFGIAGGRLDHLRNHELLRWAQRAGITVSRKVNRLVRVRLEKPLPSGNTRNESHKEETEAQPLTADMGRPELAAAIGAYLAKIHKAAGDAAVDKFLQDTGASTK